MTAVEGQYHQPSSWILGNGQPATTTPADMAVARSIAHDRRREAARRLKERRWLWSELMEHVHSDEVLARTRLKRVVRWLPGVGKHRGEQMLAELGISGKRKIGNLPEAMAVRLAKHRFIKAYDRRVRRLRRPVAEA